MPGQVQLNVRVDPDTAAVAREAARRAQLSLNAWCDQSLRQVAGAEGVALMPFVVDGQLTVDQAQGAATTDASAPAGRTAEGSSPGSASDRPRAAEQAERPTGDDPPVPGQEPAGCPECAGELEHGKCVDCGWLTDA